MSTKRDAPYDVGFGKPPAANKFKPGQSGNPKGRPKGTLNLATTIRKALRERITVVEDGKRRLISKLDAAIIQLVNRAVKGDARATQQLLTLTPLFDGESVAVSMGNTSDGDQEIITGVLKRWQEAEPDTKSAPTNGEKAP